MLPISISNTKPNTDTELFSDSHQHTVAQSGADADAISKSFDYWFCYSIADRQSDAIAQSVQFSH